VPLPRRFRYPRRLLWTVRLLGYGLILLALAALVSRLVWAAGEIARWGLGFQGWWLLIGPFVSLLLAFALGALLINAFPTFEPTGDGLVLHGFIRPITLPWARVAMLRSMELPGDRYVVFLEYNGRPLTFEHQFYSTLAGLGTRPGIFLTSAVDRFDDLLRLILRQRIAATPRGLPGSSVESLLDEQADMLLFQMLFDPQVTAVRLGDLPAVDPDAPVDDWHRALTAVSERAKPRRAPLIRLQVGMALLPVAIFWIDGLTRGFVPNYYTLIATVGLLGLGILELFLVALVVQALGENLFGLGLFNTAFQVFPYLELPRVPAFLLIFLLLALQGWLGGLVILLAALIWLGAAAWTAYLTALFTMRLYQVDLRKAAIPGTASFAVQFVLVLLYLFLR
jgi:hypothetical protein